MTRLLPILFYSFFCFSQERSFDRLVHFDHINQETVYDIKQDADGFLWFSSDDGLHRYDGKFVVRFDKFRQDSARINIGQVLSFEIDQNELIWIGTTEHGLLVFDKKIHQISKLQLTNNDSVSAKRINRVYEQGDYIYAATNVGLFRVNQFTKKISKISPENQDVNFVGATGFRDEVIFSISTIELEQQVKYLNTTTLKIRDNRVPELENIRIRSTYNYKDSLFLIGSDKGLFVIDVSDGEQFRNFNMSDSSQIRLTSNSIYDITRDNHGIWWLATSNGLNEISSNFDAVFPHMANPNRITSISGDVQYSLFYDYSSNLWIGTWASGLNQLNQVQQRFIHKEFEENNSKSLSHNMVWNFSEDQNGYIWLATEGSLERYDPKTEVFNRFSDFYPNSKLDTRNIYYTFVDSRGLLWVGTAGAGLYCVNLVNGKTIKYTSKGQPSGLPSDIIYLIREDKHGDMWIGTINGVAKFNYEDKTFTNYLTVTENSGFLFNSSVALEIDQSENVWVGTSENGLHMINPTTDEITTFSSIENLSTKFILSLFIDNEQQLWIGTEKGAVVYDIENKTSTLYTKDDGLSSNIIYGTIQDNKQNYWLITHHGISLIEKETNAIYSFSTTDGLQHHEFNQGSLLKSKSGDLYFGGVNGINILDHKGFDLNLKKPNIVITDIRVDGKLIYYDGSGSIELSENVSSLTVIAASLDYTNTTKNLYKFMLGQPDGEWTEPSIENVETFQNMKSGEFTIRVLGSNNDGIWANEPAVLKVIIPAPFYATLWFNFAVGVLLVILVYLTYQLRLNRYRKHQKELKEQVEERTLELAKSTARLEHLNAFVKAINLETDLKTLVRVMLEESVLVPSIQKGSVVVLDHEKRDYYYIGANGWALEDLKTTRYNYDILEGWVTQGSTEILPNVYVISDFTEKETVFTVPQTTMIIRIEIETVTEGYIFFDNLEDRDAFINEDIKLIANLNEHILAVFNKVFLLDKLRYLNELKNEFFGIAIHDLRSPLTQIAGYADIISLEIEDTDVADRSLLLTLSEKIVNSTMHMSEMLSTLLDISAIETGKLKLNVKKENYLTIVEECEEMNRRRALQKEISISIKKPSDELTLNIDRNRIMEVVDNLLNNAIKYTNRGGSIYISFEQKKSEIVTHIEDNGLGISDENLVIMFKSFRPFGDGPTEGEKSTGFGLAIVKKIVEIHGGTVWAKSEKGKGSTFSFSLPLQMSEN